MFEAYLNEIIAVIAIVTATIIFLKLKNSNKNSSTESTKKQEPIQEIIIEKEIVPEIKKEKPMPTQEIQFDGEEEGSFEVEKEVQATRKTKNRKTKKRAVPPHGKITKQHFKEFSGLKILVAEDNLINQKVITGLLADTGIEITIADDGQEALDILEKNSDFTIVIMDVHMPRMDGFEATRAIKKNSKYNHITVVALSGDTASDDIKKMTDAGMQEHLEKPLRMDALYDIFYAYFTSYEEESDHNDYIHVVDTKELDGNRGLEICGGDDEFYREILNEFIETYENSTDELQTLLHNDNLKEADKILLDIIGVTANIGAENLNSIAVNIKYALKDTQEKSYLTLTQNYKESLQELLKDIKEYL